ncbi:MAG: tetratricopeptide repeat protein [Saccharothrix sp.]|nr:tetratricopeptide repeat protein [Saccharothrix sp.]
MTHNEIVDAKVGQVVQAGIVHGGVHFHAGAGADTLVPRQLPAAPAGFVGRDTELARLDEILGRDEEERVARGPGLSILLVTGAGGLGKTWLALHWAHRVSERFPDGCLFADLRGFSPDGVPTPPSAVLSGFLEALGVAPERVPAGTDARAALYRSLSADKRLLVVLDNAADTAQVAPLLPGGASCVVVTARDRLPALVTGHSANPVVLDVLGYEQARALLVGRLKSQQPDDQTLVIDELVRLCRGFPLALAIVAGRAAAHPHVPLSSLAAELHTLGLSAMGDADLGASLPDVFSWSLRALDDQQVRAFSLLGISPGPDVALDAASRLIDVTLPEAHAILRGLCKASLLDRNAHGRYVMHDLIRRFAVDQGRRLPAADRVDALHRVLDFYVHTALAGDRVLEPHRDHVIRRVVRVVSDGRRLSDTASCLRWFDIEYRCLSAARRTAAELGLHRLVWSFAWATDTFNYRRGHRHEQLQAWQDGLRAAEELGDPVALLYAHRGVGVAYARSGDHLHGTRHLELAIRAAEDVHDSCGQADALYVFAWIKQQQQDIAGALGHAVRALELYRRVNDPVGEADTINAIAYYIAHCGNLDLARRYCRLALALHRHHRHLAGQAHVLEGLGHIAHQAADQAEAVLHYSEAALLFEELGDDYFLANTLDVLGDVYVALQRHDRAHAAWNRAADLYNAQQRRSNLNDVRAKLAAR